MTIEDEVPREKAREDWTTDEIVANKQTGAIPEMEPEDDDQEPKPIEELSVGEHLDRIRRHR